MGHLVFLFGAFVIEEPRVASDRPAGKTNKTAVILARARLVGGAYPTGITMQHTALVKINLAVSRVSK